MAHLEFFDDAEAADALIIVALHSTGAAAPIAGSFLRQQLKMPLVGHVRVPELGPVVHVADGLATSPIRILGGPLDCHIGRPCKRVYLIAGELPVPVQLVEGIAEALLGWAKQATYVLCLDAVVRDEGDRDPDVFALAPDAAALEALAATKARPLEGGIVVGMTAALLSLGPQGGVPVGALVVEAAREHPDGRAAAQLIEALDPLIPSIDIDSAPLLKEAMELEEKVQRALRDAQEAQGKRAVHTFI